LLEKIQSATKKIVVINGRKLSPTLRMLNEQHSSIKFTSEEEDNGSLPFLDVKVTRTGSCLEFDIYRKPTLRDAFQRRRVILTNTS
jgi:hypothetical protein